MEKPEYLTQLEILLRRFPADAVEIEGVILDYIARTGHTLQFVLALNPALYTELFESNPASGLRLVQSQPAASALDLEKVYGSKFPALVAAQDRLEATRLAQITVNPGWLKTPAQVLRYDPCAVFWQISDIHFGSLNKLEPDPRELAFLLAKIVADYPTLHPHFVVISGDLTTVSAESEYDSFLRFCAALSEQLWKAICPERILVVPGNHDVTWQPDGTADRLERFRSRVTSAGLCITPFGPEGDYSGGIRASVRQFAPSTDAVPPLSSVYYSDLGVELLLLATSYFSGFVPLEVRDLLCGLKGVEQEIRDLIRSDEGAINREYLHTVATVPDRAGAWRFAVAHHNPIPYGTERCANRFAVQLLETLARHEVSILLHGHTHLMEDRTERRPFAKDKAFAVPCPTLCSIPTIGGQGLNVFFISKPDETERRGHGLTWQISQASDFKEAGAMLRYEFGLGPAGLEVRHL